MWLLSFRFFPIFIYGGLFSQYALQERSEGSCAGRGSPAFLQAVSRRRICRRLWTQLQWKAGRAYYIFLVMAWVRGLRRRRGLARHELRKGTLFQVNRGCVAVAMAIVRCVYLSLGVVTSWFIRLASNLVGLWRALVADSGALSLCGGREESPDYSHPGLSGENTAGACRSVDWVAAPCATPTRFQCLEGSWRYRSSRKKFGRTRSCESTSHVYLVSAYLICHCLPSQECHADSITAEYKLLFPGSTVIGRLTQTFRVTTRARVRWWVFSR